MISRHNRSVKKRRLVMNAQFGSSAPSYNNWLVGMGGSQAGTSPVQPRMPGNTFRKSVPGPYPVENALRRLGANLRRARLARNLTPADPGAGPPILIAADDTYDPGAGFGDLGIAGALPAADASNPRGGGRSDSGAGSGSGSPGSGDNGRSGGSGGSSDSGTSSLLDPPGATGGGSSAGGDPADSNSNHQVTAPEPSTLALFLAGTAALGCALRRRRLGS